MTKKKQQQASRSTIINTPISGTRTCDAFTYCFILITQDTMTRRAYSQIQATLAGTKGIEEYKFAVNTAGADPYSGELVAGIVFKDCDPKQPADVVLSVYTYNLREGFRNLELSVKVSERNSKIALDFKLNSQPGEIPNFDDNVGDFFLATLLNSLTEEFNGKDYVKKTRNLFSLVKKLQWKSQAARVKLEQEKNSGSSSIVPIIAIIAVAAIGAFVFFKLRK